MRRAIHWSSVGLVLNNVIKKEKHLLMGLSIINEEMGSTWVATLCGDLTSSHSIPEITLHNCIISYISDFTLHTQ